VATYAAPTARSMPRVVNLPPRVVVELRSQAAAPGIFALFFVQLMLLVDAQCALQCGQGPLGRP
jgi:hypothetical protein